MNSQKRQEKEGAIIDAAESVFRSVGFKNAKMDEIAKVAGITKVTLYSYFQSKENLYLSITWRGVNLLSSTFNDIAEKKKGQPSLEIVLAMVESFMDFCSHNFLYSEALLDYFEMNRSSDSGADTTKLTEAVLQSNYYKKIQEIQNLPFKVIAREVAKGQTEGSILMTLDPMLYTLHAWTASLGYIKMMNSSGSSSIFNIDFSKLKLMNLRLAEQILLGKIDLS